MMNRIVWKLKAARDVAWSDLVPAFDLAIMQAEQAEHEAARAQNLAQTGVEPAYPPLVLRLAEAVADYPVSGSWAATKAEGA
jgi:hypothetical protein